MAFTKTDQKRITVLSLMERAVDLGAETLEAAYDQAVEMTETFESDGLFDSGNSGSRSSGRSRGSGGRGSGSRSGSRGNSRGGNRRGGGNPDWRNDPATDKQIEKAIELGALEEGHSEEDLEAMTKGEISDLIDDLN